MAQFQMSDRPLRRGLANVEKSPPVFTPRQTDRFFDQWVVRGVPGFPHAAIAERVSRKPNVLGASPCRKNLLDLRYFALPVNLCCHYDNRGGSPRLCTF